MLIGREFDRNMFIMLVAIMIGAVIITFFIADIQNKSKIDTLESEHLTEIRDIHSINENFTDNFLQGSVKMDSAREIRELGNYYFDFALFWYNTALSNTTNTSVSFCIENCSNAMNQYLDSSIKFTESKPYFETAKSYTEKERYIEVLGYYTEFAEIGRQITTLRYNASNFLKQAVENLSIGDTFNFSLLLEMFNITQDMYEQLMDQFTELKDQIDEYLFFNEIRESE